MQDARPTQPDPAYLTTQDLAERYQIPAETVRRWRIRGIGPKAVKMGKYVRYRVADVSAWELQLEAKAR